MGRWIKSVLWIGVGAIAALAAGWLWGASGKSDLRTRLQSTELKAELLEARSHLLQARVDLYNVNFGDASRNMEASKASLKAALAEWQELGASDAAAKATEALARIEEAQQLAGKLDPGANTRTASAVTLLDAIPLTSP